MTVKQAKDKSLKNKNIMAGTIANSCLFTNFVGKMLVIGFL
jgi:hypothetical protein